MKYIFPRNYNYNFKLLGILDYQTVFFNFIFSIVIYFFTKLFTLNLLTRIVIIIIICFPILLFSIFSFQQENIIYVLKYIFAFLKNPKIYLYNKLN